MDCALLTRAFEIGDPFCRPTLYSSTPANKLSRLQPSTYFSCPAWNLFEINDFARAHE